MQQATSVALVVEKVEKMTVQDNEKEGEVATTANMNISDNRTINLHDKNATSAAKTIVTNNKSLVADINKSCTDTAKSSESSNNKGLEQEAPAEVHTKTDNTETAGQKKN
jgi:hypothetical protein